jgi:PAS domain S-box-containing protein
MSDAAHPARAAIRGAAVPEAIEPIVGTDAPGARPPSSPVTRRRTGSQALPIVGLALLYFVTGRFGLSFAAVGGVATAVWPPAGIALAALLRFGPALWPGVAIGAFAVNLSVGAPWWVAACVAAGNTAAALAGAGLVRRAAADAALERVRDVLALVVLAAGVAPLISATVGTLSAAAGAMISAADLARAWFTWWLGDAVGVLVIAPPLLTRATPRPIARRAEAAACLGLLAVTSWVIFEHPAAAPSGYAVFPFLVWAALRLEQRVVSAGVLLAAAIAVGGTVAGAGPFAEPTLLERLRHLQIFMAVLATTALVLGAAIAERRRSGAALQRSEHHFRALIEHATDLIGVLDGSGIIRMISPSVTRVLGYARDEWIGHLAFDFVHPEDHAAVVAEFARGLREGTTGGPIVFRVRHRDGTWRVLEAMDTNLLHEEAVGGIVINARDVTDRDRVERALRAGEERLQLEARHKDEFLATLAHELRNPLAPIRTAVEILRRASDGRRAAAAREIIDRQVAHMARLVDDLLDVARISRGKLLVHREALDLGALAATVVEDHRPLFDAAGVSLALARPPDPVVVQGDPTRLSQVIGNLLQNAVKFTERGGRVDVRVAAVPDADMVEVAVRDDGAGFPPALGANVFEPLRHPELNHDQRAGLGLGLALAKGLVALHEGTVTASSEGLGRGATFTIRLPLDATARLGAAPSAPRAASPHRVLIIDDNADAADAMQALLELQGHAATTAYTGEQGIERAAAFHPDIVLCDIGLPHGMDGYAVARRLREQYGRDGIRLIAVTGYGQPDDRRRAAEAGFDLHLTKPVDPARLEALLGE